MAQGNHNLDEALRLLSKEVDFRTFAKLKALTNSSDSEFLNGQLFEYFRKRQGDIPFSEVLSLPSEASDPVKTRLLSWLVRWRRLLEPWEGEALHSAIGEIKWGLSRGMGEDLEEYLSKAAQLAYKQEAMPALLEILGLERQVVITYWATGEKRIKRLELISAQRQKIIEGIKAGQKTTFPTPTEQADQTGIHHRVKSDLLFRISNSLTDKECDELKRHIQLHRKDAKQFRLLDYYRQISEWSREQEKRDWVDENLSMLKSNTLAWLIRNMARYGEWQWAELHHLIGDIKWAISKGIEMHLNGHFQKALLLAKEMEAHEVVLDLLALGREYFGAVDQLRTLYDWAFDQLEEIETVNSLRLLYFEPIRLQNKVTGQNHISAWQTFQVILEDSNWDRISASAAMREILGLRLLASMSLNTFTEAKATSLNLLRLLSDKKTLPSQNWAKFFEELRVCCLALVLSGHPNEALSVIDEIGHLEKSNPSILVNSALHRLLALSYVYDATHNASLAEMGLKLYADSRIYISRTDDSQRYIWLLSFVAKAALDLGRFATAKEVLNELLDNKVKAPPLLVAHSRVRLLLSLLGNKVESEVVGHAANACLAFLKRNEGTPKHLQQVVYMIKKVSQFESGSKEQINALEKAALDSEELLPIEAKEQGFNLNYTHIFRQIALVVKTYQ